jgi:hypothetical protein
MCLCHPCASPLPRVRPCVWQSLYAESIAYANPLSGTSVAAQQLRNLRAGASEVPVLTKGTIVLVLPSEDTYEARVRGEYLPFWVCKLVEDEDAPLGMLSFLCPRH